MGLFFDLSSHQYETISSIFIGIFYAGKVLGPTYSLNIQISFNDAYLISARDILHMIRALTLVRNWVGSIVPATLVLATVPSLQASFVNQVTRV